MERIPVQNFEEEEKLKSALDKIMTIDEYSQVEHEVPYVFEIKTDNEQLTYFGSPHVRDPKDPTFSKIEEAFKKTNPDVVFVEAFSGRSMSDEKFMKRINDTSREDVIKMAGESGFAVKLANEKGIEWVCPEPSDSDLYNHLVSEGFSQEEIFAFEFLNILPAYNRQTNKEELFKNGFKDFVAPSINKFRDSTNWDEFDYSYENATHIIEKVLGETIDIEKFSDADKFLDPIRRENSDGTTFNKISRVQIVFRDKIIVTKIAETLKVHKNIFIVYGNSHAVMERPALEELTKEQ
jgi:hypothetical protein